MSRYSVEKIGTVRVEGENACIEVLPAFRSGLKGLEGYSHIQMIWWFDGNDNDEARATLTVLHPHGDGKEPAGVFATRSPRRPNPIALTCEHIIGLDCAHGIIRLARTDARNGSPVIDIKPYSPGIDRVEHPVVPAWCSHWPNSVEESAASD